MNIKDHLVFSYSETYGPFTCETPDCENTAWIIVINETEYKEVEELERHKAAIKIMEGTQGKALCEDCFTELLKK